jgi:hypothetical protein
MFVEKQNFIAQTNAFILKLCIRTLRILTVAKHKNREQTCLFANKQQLQIQLKPLLFCLFKCIYGEQWMVQLHRIRLC